MTWKDIARRVLNGQQATREQAMTVLRSSDDELLELLDAAFLVRQRYFGRGVQLSIIRNAQSGLCAEDCAFCCQTVVAKRDAPRYPMQSVEEIVEGALEARRLGAMRYCIVTSGRQPFDVDLERICEAARRIKKDGGLEICVSLGLLDKKQARRLARAGVDRYNHNLETSVRYFPKICTTHGWRDRFTTARTAKNAGLSLCCGGIIGMGEEMEDRVALAFSIAEIQADSVPVNFFNPCPGTPLESLPRPSAADCLRALAMFRFVNPGREIRAADGREACLGPLQALALYPANSIFTGGHLTTPVQGWEADRAMLAAADFTVKGRMQA